MTILSVLVFLWGILMLVKPEWVYEMTESWKHNSGSDPSDWYLFSTRFGGVMCSLVGLVGTVYFLFFS